jgi:hypothetical protein
MPNGRHCFAQTTDMLLHFQRQTSETPNQSVATGGGGFPVDAVASAPNQIIRWRSVREHLHEMRRHQSTQVKALVRLCRITLVKVYLN